MIKNHVIIDLINRRLYIIFLCNVFHAGLPSRNSRQTIQSRFGSDGKHSKNYVNYTLKYRKEACYHIDNSNKATVDDFFNLLKKHNIYYPIAQTKEHIEGVKVPKYEKD